MQRKRFASNMKSFELAVKDLEIHKIFILKDNEGTTLERNTKVKDSISARGTPVNQSDTNLTLDDDELVLRLQRSSNDSGRYRSYSMLETSPTRITNDLKGSREGSMRQVHKSQKALKGTFDQRLLRLLGLLTQDSLDLKKQTVNSKTISMITRAAVKNFLLKRTKKKKKVGFKLGTDGKALPSAFTSVKP